MFVPALVGLGAPYWDPHARGAIFGLTRGTTAAHLARATVESMAFQTRDLLRAMQQDAATPLAELKADGGASVNDALMQFQADLLGMPVVRPVVTETTAHGRRVSGRPGRRLLERPGRSGEALGGPSAIHADDDADERDRRYRQWQRAVERTRVGWED